MIANYHTHTWRCHHASGTEREYIEEAIKGGLAILGFSDHAPMPYEGGHTPGVRMEMDQLDDYVETVQALRKEYAGALEIHIGLEAEYYPKYWDAFLKEARAHSIEYLIMGQHFLGNETDGAYSGRPCGDENTLIQYVEQVIEGLSTGCFTYLAHPDLFNYTGSPEVYEKHMRRLCRFTREAGIPLEINLLGLGTHRNYPNPLFWKIAGEEGNTAILGSDAHMPGNVVRPELIREGGEIAEANGLPILETADVSLLVKRGPFWRSDRPASSG